MKQITQFGFYGMVPLAIIVLLTVSSVAAPGLAVDKTQMRAVIKPTTIEVTLPINYGAMTLASEGFWTLFAIPSQMYW